MLLWTKKKGLSMKRILEGFKNLFNGENPVKTHLLMALLLLLPAMSGSMSQFLDKDYKAYWNIVTTASIFLGVLSIIPILFLFGFWIKFIKRRLTENVGLPEINRECLYEGIKFFPLVLVWFLYIIAFVGILTLVLKSFIFAVAFGGNSGFSGWHVLVLAIAFALILLITSSIVCPFISLIFMKYAEAGKFSSELFNPLTLFRYMKKTFVDGILTALKFFAVNIITSFAAQALCMILIAPALALLLAAAVVSPKVAPLMIIIVFLFGALGGIIQGYAQQITALAYTDNMIDVYKDKIQTSEDF